MKSETATAAKTYFGKLLDNARKEPVMITKSGRPVAVMMAYEDYEALTAAQGAVPAAADPAKKPKRRSVAKRYRSILKYRIKRKEREEKGGGPA